MKLAIAVACLFLSAAVLGAKAPGEFDRPLRFTSAEEVYRLASKPRDDWHPQFGAAMTYLTLCVPGRDSRLSDHQRDELLVRIADGRSPRQLMILGLTLRIEILKVAYESDVKAAEEEHRPQEDRAFLKLRASHAAAELEMDYSVLKTLVEKEPKSGPRDRLRS